MNILRDLMDGKNNDKGFLSVLTDPVQLYEHAPCGYLSFFSDGNIVKVNSTLLGWLGYPREAVEGKMRFSDLVSRGGKVYYEMFYIPLLQLQPMVNEISFEFLRADGTRFPALVNSSTFRDEHGRLVAINATVHDITERKKYEGDLLSAKRIADSERAKFELLSDFIPEMIFTVDANGEITYVNQRFSRFFQLPGGDVSNSAVMSKVDRRDRSMLLRSWKQAVEQHRDFQTEVRLEKTPGIFQWHLLRALPVRSGDGAVERWMGSCTDIDRHVKAIEHLDEFISVASHELRTPITTAIASLQLLERLVGKMGDPMLSKLTEQASRNTEKIGSLVQDLLSTGNIKAGEMVLNKKVFDVSSLLRQTCQHISLEGKFELEILCDNGLLVVGDEQRIDQVMVNFVNNAVKYAPSSRKIQLLASCQDGLAKISVRDFGQGIQPEKVPYIFDRYYRASHDSKGYTGLGLGLYICSEIVRRHGGQIGVESTLGQGTTFWFTLPLALEE